MLATGAPQQGEKWPISQDRTTAWAGLNTLLTSYTSTQKTLTLFSTSTQNTLTLASMS